MTASRRGMLRALLLAFALLPLGAATETDWELCPPSSSPPLIKRKGIVLREGRFGEGTLEFHPGVVILKLHGNPFEMGYQHGAVLRDELRERLAREESRRRPAARSPLFLDKARSALAFYPGLSADAREELHGLSKGSGLSVLDLSWLNALSLSAEETERKAVPPAWLSLDFPGWMIAVYHPEDEPKYAAVTRPGAFGALGGMRESGCCLIAEGDDRPLPGQRFMETRRKLGMGLCGEDPDLLRKSCALELKD